MFVLSIVASTGRVGNVLVALRCVEIRDKAISMAFQVLEKSCHSGFFCIESGSGKKIVYFCVCFWLQKRTTAWKPPVYPLLGFYSIFNYTIHFNTWMVTHPSLTLQRQRVTLPTFVFICEPFLYRYLCKSYTGESCLSAVCSKKQNQFIFSTTHFRSVFWKKL